MNKDEKRHSCSQTPKFAPSKAVGPVEFEHALQCDDCWAALIRWLDTEVKNLPEDAEIRQRAERLAGVAEIMAAMSANGDSIDHETIADEVFDEATLDDVLDAAQSQSTLIRGPWSPAPRRTLSRNKEKSCANGTTVSSPSPESTDGCTSETSTETAPDGCVCRFRSVMTSARTPTMNEAVPAVGPVTVALGNDAIEALKKLAGLDIAGLSATTVETNVCVAVSRPVLSPLCEECAWQGVCQLKPIPHVDVNIRVPLYGTQTSEDSLDC